MTEEKAIEILTGEIDDDIFILTEYRQQLHEALKMGIEAIKQTRMTPVSEGLPKIQNCSKDYLVTLKRGGVFIATFTECNGKHWWTYDDVVAWEPLPKEYKEESEEHAW